MRALILGGNGYGGGELLRLLLGHPAIQEVRATSRQYAGQPFTVAHPHLAGLYEQGFDAEPDFDWLGGGVLFSAMPHGELAKIWPDIRPKLHPEARVVDLSADFRIASPERFLTYYGTQHPCPKAIAEWTYGLPEIGAVPQPGSRFISNPGCFATALQLAIHPLLAAGAHGPIMACGITGSSGSGASPSATTHHPSRAHDFRAYKALEHQHMAEVEQMIGDRDVSVHFVPHSAPLVRGIHITVQAAVQSNVNTITQAWVAAHPFLRFTPQPPRVAPVVGSNFADIGVAQRGDHACVMVAIDNLMKGMAGQAIQNLNLALDLPETTGLWFPPAYPG